jgi:hypothetical protein
MTIRCQSDDVDAHGGAVRDRVAPLEAWGRRRPADAHKQRFQTGASNIATADNAVGSSWGQLHLLPRP